MQNRERHRSRAGILWLLVLGCSFLASCSGEAGPPKKATVPVKGQLFFRAQPAAGAMLFFQPQDGSKPEDWSDGYPRATVAADGSFVVSTYEEADGAPPGDYIVTSTWPDIKPGAEESEETPPDRFRGRFLDPSMSPLRAKVGESATDLPRFDLK